MNSLLEYSFRENILGHQLFDSIINYHNDYQSYILSGGNNLDFDYVTNNQKKQSKKKQSKKKQIKKKQIKKKQIKKKQSKIEQSSQEIQESSVTFSKRDIITQDIEFIKPCQEIVIEKQHRNLNFYFKIPRMIHLKVNDKTIRYKIESNLDDTSSLPTGGFSCIVTYRPKHKQNKLGVAMKCIDVTSLLLYKNTSEEKIQREINILREIQQFSKIDNVQTLVHFIGDKREVITRTTGEEHEISYILMEKMDHDLSHLLRLEQSRLEKILTMTNFRLIGRQIYDGLAALHNNNLVHNDMKPGNILYSVKQGKVVIRLTDFNGSFHIVPIDKQIESKTTGTLGYNSPEKTYDYKNVTEKTDVWTTALILYQLVNCYKTQTKSSKRANEARLKGSSPVLIISRRYKKNFCHITDKIQCKKKQIHYLLSEKLHNLIEYLQKGTGFLQQPEDIKNYKEILENSLCKDINKRWSAKKIMSQSLFIV